MSIIKIETSPFGYEDYTKEQLIDTIYGLEREYQKLSDSYTMKKQKSSEREAAYSKQYRDAMDECSRLRAQLGGNGSGETVYQVNYDTELDELKKHAKSLSAEVDALYRIIERIIKTY